MNAPNLSTRHVIIAWLLTASPFIAMLFIDAYGMRIVSAIWGCAGFGMLFAVSEQFERFKRERL